MTDTVINMQTALNERVIEIQEKLKTAITANADMKEINQLTRDLTAAKKAQSSISRMMPVDDDEDDDAKQRAEDIELLKADIRLNILSQYDYYYVNNAEKFVLYNPRKNTWSYNSPRGMSAINSKLIPNSDYYNLFMDVLKEDNRWFLNETASFNPEPDELNRLRYTKMDPIDEPHDPLFDTVVRSICGDRKENIDHVEQVIVAKWNNPANFMLPVLCLSDNGATGKSLFVSTVLTALFGSTSVSPNVPMSDFAGQFNGHLCGKLVIMINENCEERYNHDRMKMIAGSPRVSYTYKGQTTFDADNTALLIVTGNSIAGSIRVGGGDVDRRFSVIRGNKKLSTYTAPYLSQLLGEKVTERVAESWMKTQGQNILKDPVEVAKWLNSLVKKHGLLEDVHALHGADYSAAVATQKPLIEQCFEAIFHRSGFDYVKKPLVYEFYRHEALLQGNRLSMGKGKFYQMVDTWLQANAPTISVIKANWAGSTADVYADATVVSGVARPSLHPNEDKWYLEDGYSKRWKVSI